jgi:sugar lactone lactonase YvrE
VGKRGKVLVAVALLLGTMAPAATEAADPPMARQLAGPISSPLRKPVAMVKVGQDLFVLDENAVSRVNRTTGDFEVFAGERPLAGGANATGRGARFNKPRGIATDGTNLYVADTANHTIRKIVIATREVTKLVGTKRTPGSVDGTGSAARFSRPYGVAIAGDGNLYATDMGNHTVRKVVLGTRTVSTIAGKAGTIGSVDGTGAAARFVEPKAITANGTQLWVTDGPYVRGVATGGVVSTVASVDTGYGWWIPISITTDGTKLYVASRAENDDGDVWFDITEVDPVTHAVATWPSPNYRFFFDPVVVTANATRLWLASSDFMWEFVIATRQATSVGDWGARGFVDGTGSAARFHSQGGAMASDGTTLYVIDQSASRIRKVDVATGAVTTLPTPTGFSGSDLVPLGGALYVANYKTIKKVDPRTGADSVFATLTDEKDSVINGITTDGTHLYLTNGNCAIYKVSVPSAVVTVLAGERTMCGHVDGTGSEARFGMSPIGPYALASDGTNLYVRDWSGPIRKIVITTATVTTIGGGYYNEGIAFAAGKLYIGGGGAQLQTLDPATGATTDLTPRWDEGPDSLTYQPTLASATGVFVGTRIAVDPSGQHLYFNTFGTGIGVLDL